jgi:hypothetical protein
MHLKILCRQKKLQKGSEKKQNSEADEGGWQGVTHSVSA